MFLQYANLRYDEAIMKAQEHTHVPWKTGPDNMEICDEQK